MKIAIMQPYLFPYIGYFSLIAHSDKWVVFDITQYTPKSWINRNRVLHPKTGWQYITLPLQNSSQSIKIKEARILNLQKAKDNVLGKLSHYKKKAPFYSKVIEIVSFLFAEESGDSLVNVNIRGMQSVCDYIGIPFHYEICSELNLPLPDKMPPGSWAPTISKLLGATDYINPIGGRELFDFDEFRQNGIDLHFLEQPEFSYKTYPYEFVDNLSIIDVLMWNDPQTVREIIDKARII